MGVAEELSFDHEDRRRIYDYVERHGVVEPDRVRDALGIDPRGFRHHVAILRRDRLIDVDESGIRIVVADSESEEHSADGIDFTIRQARQEDLAGLVGAIRTVAEAGTDIEAESVADVVDHEEVLLRHNELESRVFFVATVEDEVVGWVHLAGPELEKLAHTAELTVGVLERYRGHGIGARLLERGLEWAAAHDYEKIYNSVPATNDAAVSFLEAHGWDVEAVRDDHYVIDGAHVDEVMMAVRLSPRK